MGAHGRAKALARPLEKKTMARNSFNQIQSAPMRRRPMNPLVPLGVVLIILVGLLFFLSHSATQVPLKPIEVDVARAPAAQ